MNIQSWIILAVVVFCVVIAIKVYRKKGSACSCGCSETKCTGNGCSCCNCQSRHEY